jgi:hypothetical protein
MEQQLIAALGDALQMPSNLVNYLVKLESLKDARRRLQVLSVSFQVLASSEAEASLLSKSVMAADIQVCTYFSLHAFIAIYLISIILEKSTQKAFTAVASTWSWALKKKNLEIGRQCVCSSPLALCGADSKPV